MRQRSTCTDDDVRVNIENTSTGSVSLRRLCIFILALRVTRERTSHSSLKGNYEAGVPKTGRKKQENQRERVRRRNRSCTRVQETWLYFWTGGTTRGGEFRSRRALLHPRPFRRGENFGKSISMRRSDVVAATFRRVSGFTKLPGFSRAAAKESAIECCRILEINFGDKFCNKFGIDLHLEKNFLGKYTYYALNNYLKVPCFYKKHNIELSSYKHINYKE